MEPGDGRKEGGGCMVRAGVLFFSIYILTFLFLCAGGADMLITLAGLSLYYACFVFFFSCCTYSVLNVVNYFLNT